jgi:predicted peptidase
MTSFSPPPATSGVQAETGIRRRLRTVRVLLAVLGLTVSAAASITPASATVPEWAGPPGHGSGSAGIQSVTPITKVYTFGQEVAAVAVEYSANVNPRLIDLDTFTVSDSIYNFRFNPLEDLAVRADRTITRVYTNNAAALNPAGTSRLGRFVIVELDPADPGGNTVIRGRCPSFLCYEKVNPDLPTEVVQNDNIHAQPGNGVGRGKLISAASETPHPVTEQPINLLVDDFRHDTFVHAGTEHPYAYHLPADYDPAREYPLVVTLPGWGSGYDPLDDNRGVQLAVDIPPTAWLQSEWTGTDEDVIVLALQTQRIGSAAESAAMVALLEVFMDEFGVDQDRVYVSTFSWGSTLAWNAMANHPGLFTAALIAAGFQVSPDQAALIAQARTPIWIVHGTNDHVLPVSFGQTSTSRLRSAYVAVGVEPADAEDLIRYTEYGNEAFSQPDYHASFGPAYEDSSILQWLLQQEQ